MKLFEPIKRRIIKNLIEEIKCLGSNELEMVGHNVLSVVEGRPMVHRGINKNYKPAGYTVDSYSENSKVIGEYSTEAKYFVKQDKKGVIIYEKINKDITHALAHNDPGQIEKIYLISNQEEPPSFRKEFNNSGYEAYVLDKIIIYDARELAGLVYKQSVESPRFADVHKDFFPAFSQDLDNYEYYGRLPPLCENHIVSQEQIGALKDFYVDNSICVLYGVSGSGKTQAAIQFVHEVMHDFDNYIWLSGDAWSGESSLSSVKRVRGGNPQNVDGSFNTTKSILVIDNFRRAVTQELFSDLKDGLDKGGVILITSQKSVPNSSLYMQMPKLSRDLALMLLGEKELPETDMSEDFAEKFGFLPLALSITRKIIEEECVDREEVYLEFLTDPNIIYDDDGKSITTRMLSQLDPNIMLALKKIANSGSNYHDVEFLRYFIFTWHAYTSFALWYPYHVH